MYGLTAPTEPDFSDCSRSQKETLIKATIAATDALVSEKSVFAQKKNIVFEDIIPGTVAFATVAGNRETGAHDTFVSIPAGQATPLHSHGVDDNASNVVLNDGSYYYVPASAKHTSRCAAESPTTCLTHFHQDNSTPRHGQTSTRGWPEFTQQPRWYSPRQHDYRSLSTAHCR